MSYIVIDTIIQIKNGYLARKSEIRVPYSKYNEQMLTLLKEEKYIKSFEVEKDLKKKRIKVELLYDENKNPMMHGVKIFSKPGRRIYIKAKEIKPTLNWYGTSILSTPKGLISTRREKKIIHGGEKLFDIW